MLAGSLNAAEPVRLDDLGRLRSVSQLTLDPSGGRAVAVVNGFSGVDPQATKTRELWLIDLEDGRLPRLLTQSGSCSQPTFSTDGAVLFFLREGNIWQLPMSGGESRALTTSGNIRQFLCAPDGQSLVFVQPRPQPSLSDGEADPNGDAAQRRAWLRGQEASGRVRRYTGPEFVGEELSAHRSIASWFNLISPRKHSAFSPRRWATTPSPNFCLAKKLWCARAASTRNPIRPFAETVGCGGFLWMAVAHPCCCSARAPFCLRLVHRGMAICSPSPN
ncbi:MAG: hypothetical protein AAFO67_05370 [Planctomycetota bacterium]